MEEMNKNLKTLIISFIVIGLMSSTTPEAFCLSLDLFKKKDSNKVEKQQKTVEKKVVNEQKEQKSFFKISKAKNDEKQNIKKEEPVKKEEVKKQKSSEEKKLEEKNVKDSKKLEKPEKAQKPKKVKKAKKEKYDDTLVTAKTDKNKPSVRIIVKGNKKADSKNQQDKKTKKKKSSKKGQPEIKEIQMQQPPETLQEEAFAPANAVEGSVSATRIISVDDCVKIALENNPTILSQLISKDIYKNQIAQAWSNYFPTISAQASYSRNDMMVTNFKFPMQKYNLWNMPSLSFNQLIYDFGKTGAQAGVAKKTYEAARETLQSSINEVVYQVKSAYFNQLYLQQQVEVYEESVLQYQIHLEQAKAYYAIGGKAKIDVSTAEYNLDNTKLTLVQAKNAVESGFAQLTNAMGVPEFAKFDIQDRLDKRKYNITFDESLKIATQQNPTLLAAKKKMEGSKLLVKSSKVAFLPDITGFGSYSRGGGEPSKDYGYQIGAGISYTNLNLLLLKQQVDQATLTYKKDQADYETQRQKVYLDVKQAYIQLKNAQESIPVARASKNVAKERYDLAAGRYKAGLGDAIELKDAQTEYMNAKLQYYNTLMQYHISAANLERVIGAPLTATEVNL